MLKRLQALFWIYTEVLTKNKTLAIHTVKTHTHILSEFAKHHTQEQQFKQVKSQVIHSYSFVISCLC